MLKHLLGKELKPLSIDWEKMGELKKFSQQEFVDLKKVPDESMAIAQIK